MRTIKRVECKQASNKRGLVRAQKLCALKEKKKRRTWCKATLTPSKRTTFFLASKQYCSPEQAPPPPYMSALVKRVPPCAANKCRNGSKSSSLWPGHVSRLHFGIPTVSAQWKTKQRKWMKKKKKTGKVTMRESSLNIKKNAAQYVYQVKRCPKKTYFFFSELRMTSPLISHPPSLFAFTLGKKHL